MWEFLQSKTGVILVLALILAALAAVLLHSIFTRRAVKRMLDYKYAEMSVLSMFAEVERNREKYDVLPASALETDSGDELLERMNYHLLAKSDGNPLDWILQQQGAMRAAYLALWVRQEMRMGNFPQLFWGERSGEVVRDAASAYRAIGAPGCAKVLEKTKETVDARLEKRGAQAALRRWAMESAADDFRWYDKREHVREKLADYLRRNRELVCEK